MGMTNRFGARKFLALRISPWGLLTAAGFLGIVGTFAGFLVGIISTFAGFLGGFAWWLDLASHFRVQYLLLFALLAVFFALRRRWWMTTGSILLACINLATVLPMYFGGDDPVDGSARPYRAMLINVNTRFGNLDAVVEAIKKERPDFVVFEEISMLWVAGLTDLRTEYPYREIETREDNFGIGLFSRHAAVTSDIVYIGDAGVPSVYGKFQLEGSIVTILGTHPLPPGGSIYSAYRNDQLAKLPDFTRTVKGALLLLGDLNVSPWSPYFAQLLRTTGLKDSARGRGVQPTWPAFAIPFLIPIDHCLYSEELVILDKRVGNFIGSDHFPVIVDFALNTDKPGP